jgi:ATP-dependent Lon protease
MEVPMTDQAPDQSLGAENIPKTLPILPLFDATLFPKMVLPLVVMEGESIQLVDEAMSKDRIVGLLVSKRKTKGRPDPEQDLVNVGTAALILKMAKTEDSKAQLLVQGIGRFRVTGYLDGRPYLNATVAPIEEVAAEDTETEALKSNLLNQFARVVELSPGLPSEIGAMAKSIQEAGVLADMVASTINTTPEEKQTILEMQDVKVRLQAVTRQVNHQLEVLELGNKIQTQVKGDMEKSQREYYLRQQLKAIKEELGEKDEAAVEVEDYRAKIEARNLPEEALKEAERELNRLARMHPSSAEYTVASTYLDWITSLPWHENTEDNLDIDQARTVLDEDHYGLEKPKKRIIEYLAVRKLKKDSKGPILCFAGPPGTGKTSLGRSIARAIGRKFHRISLGGVRDEAEIRGHRRTYVGALPGRDHPGAAAGRIQQPGFHAG